jgi:DNA repair exonuclease SbcCD ATPase subunit
VNAANGAACAACRVPLTPEGLVDESRLDQVEQTQRAHTDYSGELARLQRDLARCRVALEQAERHDDTAGKVAAAIRIERLEARTVEVTGLVAATQPPAAVPREGACPACGTRYRDGAVDRFALAAQAAEREASLTRIAALREELRAAEHSLAVAQHDLAKAEARGDRVTAELQRQRLERLDGRVAGVRDALHAHDPARPPVKPRARKARQTT